MTEAEKAYAAAERLIEEARVEGWDDLYFDKREFRALEVIPPGIESLPDVRVVDLDNTSVTDLSPLASCEQIRTLRVSGTPVTDLTPIARLSALTVLRLNRSQVTDLTPIAGLNALRMLDLKNTQVIDLTPIAALNALTRLDLSNSQAADLRPLRGLSNLRDAPEFGGLTFHGSAAAAADPEIARISEIEHDRERAAALFAYWEDWVPPKSPDARLEEAVRGEMLSESLVEIEEQAEQFQAASLSDTPSKPIDRRHDDLVATLTYAAGRFARADAKNRLGEEIVQSAKDYRLQIGQRELNGRLLVFLANGVRGAMADTMVADALDAMELKHLGGFLSEHDTLIREYYTDALRGAAYEAQADPEVLVQELPKRLAEAKAALKAGEKAQIFARNVSDTLEMLHRREEGIRRGYLLAAPEDRAKHGKELNAIAVQITAYLGRIQARLTQWTLRAERWAKEQVAYGKEHPFGVTAAAASIGAVAYNIATSNAVAGVLARLGPTFQELWKLLSNMPLPF